MLPDNVTVHKTSGTTFPLSNSSTITQTKPQVYEKRLPHFIIIGVKKSGTRALLSFIKMHPDIVTTGMEVGSLLVSDVYDVYVTICSNT